MQTLNSLIALLCITCLLACKATTTRQELIDSPSAVSNNAVALALEEKVCAMPANFKLEEQDRQTDAIMMEFASAGNEEPKDFKYDKAFALRRNTPPRNQEHQLLPSWMKVGEYSFATVLEQLAHLSPIIYISEGPILSDDWYDGYRSIIDNPDIARSKYNAIPFSPPSLLLYEHDFVEINRFSQIAPEPQEEPIHGQPSHWRAAYMSNKPMIYEYLATMAKTPGRLRLEFHGDYLNSVMFIPNTQQRIDVSQQAAPFALSLTFGKSTLKEIIQGYGFSGTLKIHRNFDRIFLNYQQEVLWHGMPLTLHYGTGQPDDWQPDGPLTHYTTLEDAVIQDLTIFHFDQPSGEGIPSSAFSHTEDEFLNHLAKQNPLSPEQVAWFYEIYASIFKEPAYTKEQVGNHFQMIDDRFILFTNGCCGHYSHIMVQTKDNFDFPEHVFQ